jgi:hypothetical protein
MQQQNGILRGVLLLVALSTFGYGYLLLFQPEIAGWYYDVEGYPDTAHVHLSMSVGVLLLVFAMGALLAMLRPARSSCMVIMLILFHFAIFLFDVVLLALGSVVPLWFMVPEMVYALIMCILLIRFFPVRDKSDLAESAGLLVNAFQKQIKQKEQPPPPPPESQI